MAEKTVLSSFLFSSNEDLSECLLPKFTQRSQPILALKETEKLCYEIHRFSSFSTNYYPDNILVDCPSDQSSRWSAQTNSPPQYLTLKLKRPAIVKRIKFGKFEKSHVCNLKKFRVYGGLEENHMVLLLESGLKNDNNAEVFTLLHTSEDGTRNIPLLYVKIVPILTWGPTFNFSIWYIELHGQDDPMYTSECLQNYNMLREKEIVRLCLKHFRQQGYTSAFKALQQQTKVQLEHPLLTQLHECLVENGDFARTEQFIEDCINDGYVDAYLKRQDYKHTWQLEQVQSELQPGNRGGHQLIMDCKNRVAYLYGGWDGFQDLSDLWLYNFETKSWSIIIDQAEKCNGPTPRSCHKMVFDPVSENIFMLGRYLDNSIRTTDYIKSDFYLYDTRARTWLLICDDTSQVGGPQLVYDHQMCLDADKRMIYVFGGKVLTPRSVNSTNTNDPEFSGLFSYHIATNTWTQILVDCHHPSASFTEVMSIKSRVTHCMVFHNKSRKLYIFGGQRGKEDIEEFITYDIDSQCVTVLNKCEQELCAENKNEPSPGYTLRATIDCDRDEIYVFSSLSKLKDRREVQQLDASNSFWVYSIAANKWSRIYTRRHSENSQPNNRADLDATKSITRLDPCPRYAHQLVYDDLTKIHYLFGGNPGKVNMPQLRLDDFWQLTLEKPKRADIFKHCRFLIRKLHYEEIARIDTIEAMQFLRSRIAEVVDHSDAEQLNSFHKLASLLFRTEDTPNERTSLLTPPLGHDIDFAATDVDSANRAQSNSGEESTASKEDLFDDASVVSLKSCTTCCSDSQSSVLSKDMKRARHDHMLKTQRSYLFNKIVRMMPTDMVQPERNLSDFVM